MKRIGLVKPPTFISIVYWIGLPLVLLYIFSMLIYPWIAGDWNWDYVEKVWSRWQGLNVGILAFISSIIAFSISAQNTRNQRKINLLAAKAFLPSALSELSEYLESSAQAFESIWHAESGVPSEVAPPPEGYKEVFRDCIKYAEPDVGNYLAHILMRLQVHSSRLQSTKSDPDWNNKPNLMTYIYRAAELQALANGIYPYARGQTEDIPEKLNWNNFKDVYSMWYIDYSHLCLSEDDGLESFTKRHLKTDYG